MASIGKSERSRSTRLPDLPRPSTSSGSRISVLSRVVPGLRRSDTITDDSAAALNKPPLVTLKFSSQSFLDSVVKDDASRSPLYIFRTNGTSTSILRSDPWDGLTKTAEVKWPTRIPTKGKTRETLGVLIQLSGGRWQPADAVLKPGTMLSSPPKFSIPNYAHSMRWKRVGNAYWCTTSSVKGPVATFHPALEGVPPRIKVYETLHDKYESGPVLSHNGVSIILIDQLIITAMLLVTDVQDWMLVQKYEGPADDTAASIAPTSSSDQETPQSAPASASQWRKILYGEPMFPKRNPGSGPSLRSVSTTDLSKPLPTTSKQMAKILYGEPIFPATTASPVTSVWDSEDELDDYDDRASVGTNSALPSPQSSHFAIGGTIPTRIHSPSAEAMYSSYPDGRQQYLESGFYEDASIPPVPQIPAQYQFAYASSSRGTTPTDSSSRPNSRVPRELPLPPTPISPNVPAKHRSQSTPPREARPGVSYERRGSEPLFLTPLSPNRRPGGRSATSPNPRLSSSSAAASTPSAPIPTSSPLASPIPPPKPTPPAISVSTSLLDTQSTATRPRALSRSQSMKSTLRQLPLPPTTPTTAEAPSLFPEASSSTSSSQRFSTTTSRSQRRMSTYSTRSQASSYSFGAARALPVPPGASVAPPLPPLPPSFQRKDDLWMYSWGPNAEAEGSAFPEAEAPPPYMLAEAGNSSAVAIATAVPAPTVQEATQPETEADVQTPVPAPAVSVSVSMSAPIVSSS